MFYWLIFGAVVVYILYKLRYNIMLLLFTRNNPVDKVYDELLLSLITNQKITSCDIQKYYITIEFSNGVFFKAWNENKYYAWLQNGRFYKETGEDIFKSSDMVSIKTMYLLREAIQRFFREKVKDII